MLPLRALVGLGDSGPSSPASSPPPPSSALFCNGVELVLLLVPAPPVGDELPPPCVDGVPSFVPVALASAMLLSPPKAARRTGAVVMSLAEPRGKLWSFDCQPEGCSLFKMRPRSHTWVCIIFTKKSRRQTWTDTQVFYGLLQSHQTC